MNIKALYQEVFVLKSFEVDTDVFEGVNIIGVSDSWDAAKRQIKAYFGDYNELEFKDIRDGNLEFNTKIYVVKEDLEYYCTLESHLINNI